MANSFSQVNLLALDVDGVLTDGGVYVLDDGQEVRRFHIHDGLGLQQIMATGIQVAVISSSACLAARFRLERLGITEIHLAVPDKLHALMQVCQELNSSLQSVCYIGDDLPDLPVMKVVGIPCAPADAVPQVKAAATYITQLAGGSGCVREVCDLILQARK